MKNKILAILVSIMLIIPAYAAFEGTSDIPQETSNEQMLESDNITGDENISSQEPSILDKELAENPYKQPVSKKKIAKKFLAAMLGVVLSSLIIYIGLSIYNRLRDGISTPQEAAQKHGDSSLETPDNLNDAIRTFMDKTRWD